MARHIKSNLLLHQFRLFLAGLILSGCTTSPIPATQVPTNSSIPTQGVPSPSVPSPEATPTGVPTETTFPHSTVDASTMEHKLLMGYQGWFSCPGDGSRVNGYFHWFKTETPDAANFRVDMWPDTSELTPG